MDVPDKGWMSLRRDDLNYLQGVDSFIDFAVTSTNRDDIACPCVKCANRFYLHRTVVRGHLVAFGIRKSYTFWYFHGEIRATNVSIDDDEEDTVVIDVGENVIQGTDNIDDEQTEDGDDEDMEDIINEMYAEQSGNTDAFYRLLDDSKLPLYDGSRISRASTILKLLHIKNVGQWTNTSFDLLLRLLKDAILPANSQLPETYYECKKLSPENQYREETIDSDATLSPDPSQAPQHSQAPHSSQPIQPSQDMGSTSRRGRGKNKNTAIGNLRPGEKMPINFNAQGRPSCQNSVHWARHIGRVIRDPNALPHTLRLWADLSQSQLDRLWQAITDPFVAAPEHIDTYRQVGLAQANKIWNGWRVKLNAHYITPHGNDKRAVRDNPPPEFSAADWNQLLDRHFFTNDFKKRSERNAQNRTHVTYVNHGGSINFEQVEERMERTSGRRPDLAELFLALHSKKTKSDDGTTRLVSSEEVQSKATQLGETSAANTHMSRFEVVESVFGRQSHGRVVALGSALTPTSFRSDQRASASSSSSTQQRWADTQVLHEENQRLQDKVSHIEAQMQANQIDMHRQMEEMRAQMQTDMNAELQRQVTEIFARFGPPPPPPT